MQARTDISPIPVGVVLALKPVSVKENFNTSIIFDSSHLEALWRIVPINASIIELAWTGKAGTRPML